MERSVAVQRCLGRSVFEVVRALVILGALAGTPHAVLAQHDDHPEVSGPAPTPEVPLREDVTGEFSR
jgi:hypothetical protein